MNKAAGHGGLVFLVLASVFAMTSTPLYATTSQQPKGVASAFWCSCLEADCVRYEQRQGDENCRCSRSELECLVDRNIQHMNNISVEQRPAVQVFLTFEPHGKTVIVLEASPDEVSLSAKNGVAIRPIFFSVDLPSKRQRFQYQLPEGATATVRGHTFASQSTDISVDGKALGDQYEGVLVARDGKLKPHPRIFPFHSEIVYSTISFPLSTEKNRSRSVFIADLMPSEATYTLHGGTKKLIHENLDPIFTEDVTIEIRSHKIEHVQGKVYIDGNQLESYGAIISRFGGVQVMPQQE